MNHCFIVPPDLGDISAKAADLSARARSCSEGADYLAVSRTVIQPTTGREGVEQLIWRVQTGGTSDAWRMKARAELAHLLRNEANALITSDVKWSRTGNSIVIERQELLDWIRGLPLPTCENTQPVSVPRRLAAVACLMVSLVLVAVWCRGGIPAKSHTQNPNDPHQMEEPAAEKTLFDKQYDQMINTLKEEYQYQNIYEAFSKRFPNKNMSGVKSELLKMFNLGDNNTRPLWFLLLSTGEVNNYGFEAKRKILTAWAGFSAKLDGETDVNFKTICKARERLYRWQNIFRDVALAYGKVQEDSKAGNINPDNTDMPNKNPWLDRLFEKANDNFWKKDDTADKLPLFSDIDFKLVIDLAELGLSEAFNADDVEKGWNGLTREIFGTNVYAWIGENMNRSRPVSNAWMPWKNEIKENAKPSE